MKERAELDQDRAGEGLRAANICSHFGGLLSHGGGNSTCAMHAAFTLAMTFDRLELAAP